MNLADPLGAATQARPHLNADERLLWAAYCERVAYDVRGLDEFGKPAKSLLRKVGSGFSDFAGGVVDAALSSEDSGSNGTVVAPPGVVVLGDRPGLVAEGLARSGAALWALTTSRLVLLRAVVTPEPEPAPETSLLGKAIGFGRGMAKFGKDVAEIVADRRKTYGTNREGEPVARREFEVAAELPRAQITGFTVAHGLHMSLVDGSGFELRFGANDPESFAWLLARTNGAT
ncbi:hypothetical protein VSH64_38255 [Amycolatopsis rhabdoformis]|uniref:ESX secretion-associated protein EspG n=1 Tax=Amycolatopsis rhabdoformis TaxID=1448059 RepID=A0ABZ1I560_9PSEU|nr:hypothetical protein [Amycolatopsis rhabdoformis]WSE28628.1 hypothetical protein VSH64_38255 [Amycolatopsis rhabdoformis]